METGEKHDVLGRRCTPAERRAELLCEILIIPTPASFPPTGFQLRAIHYRRGYAGSLTLSELPP